MKASGLKIKGKLRFGLLLLAVLATCGVQAQNTKATLKKARSESVNEKAEELSKALKGNAPSADVATYYVTLAKELADKKDYARAENYLKRALNLNLQAKDNAAAAATYRELAKTQEAQQKTAEAMKNYQNAARIATDAAQKQLNQNDADRLQKGANKEVLLQRNLNIARNSNSVNEQVETRRMIASERKAQNDNSGAISELQSALDEAQAAKSSEDVSFDIKQDLASTLSANNQHGEAIKLNKELVQEARQTQDTKTEVEQLQNLATSYLQAGDAAGSVSALQEAYHVAIKNGLTLEAKNALQQLVKYYRQTNDNAQIMALYADYIGRLDTLVRKDSTLTDEKFFHLQEEKITQLENERALKDELIMRQTRSAYIMYAALAVIFIFLLILAWILRGSLRKNKQIALQSLRREMNPHFIFNSLNSVNQFIAENNELEANKFLSSYSKLMRTIMENSNRDFISLSTELTQLREYLDLEHQRFRDKFAYTIEVDEALDADFILVPNMLIQPQLENAIWHGLRYKNGTGTLTLSIRPDDNGICATVEDDGIGLQQSQALKTAHQKSHHSRGLTNTRERIDLLNHLYHTKITMQIEDKTGATSGVRVTIHFPKMGKNDVKN